MPQKRENEHEKHGARDMGCGCKVSVRRLEFYNSPVLFLFYCLRVSIMHLDTYKGSGDEIV